MFLFDLEPVESVPLLPHNRALKYGDGVFETMYINQNRIRYLEDHMKRLAGGLAFLFIKPPTFVQQPHLLQEAISGLLKQASLDKQAAGVRLTVFRKSGGKYTPATHECHTIIEAYQATAATGQATKTDLCQTVVLQANSPDTVHKTCNAIPYIRAAIERQQRQLDEIIITNTKNDVAECGAGNFFWQKDDRLFTPPLTAGCIAGVRRLNIIKQAREAGLTVREKSLAAQTIKQHLFQPDYAFSTNAAKLTGLWAYGVPAWIER